MPIIESTQHKLDRVRPPRVQITYDVETGGAMEKQELPFVLGIMADLGRGAADPVQPDLPALPALKDRKFVEIDRDNFNAILKSIRPTLTNVKVTLPNAEGTDSDLTVSALQFGHIDDFSPLSVLTQVAELNELYEERQLLSELQSRLDGNDALTEALQKQMFHKFAAMAAAAPPPALTASPTAGAPPAAPAANGASPAAPAANAADGAKS